MSKSGFLRQPNGEWSGITPSDRYFHSEIIRCGLQDRFIGGLVQLRQESWRIIFLQSGELEIEDGPQSASFTGPALVWQPVETVSRLRVRAGSIGAHLLLGEQGLSNAIGHKPEAVELRLMTRERIYLPMAEEPQIGHDVARAFDQILREDQIAAPGSATIIEAQIRVLLVLLWRHAIRSEQQQAEEASSSQVLQRFRQLLEIHFRERWGVRDYARELGMSTDRLHDICTRVLGKPPLRLIHERTVYEAQSLLERSSRTVDQIADFLGFQTSGQFSKFFKSIVTMPPGLYRRSLKGQRNRSETSITASYADWP
ncbi:MAG: AraC family transcriptional regulator [Pseudomonadota bacterium]